MYFCIFGMDFFGNFNSLCEEAPDDARGSSTLTSLTNVYSVKALSASEDEAGMLYRLSSGSLFKEEVVVPKLILVFVIKAEAPWTESIGSALVTVTVISSWPLSSASNKLLYLKKLIVISKYN